MSKCNKGNIFSILLTFAAVPIKNPWQREEEKRWKEESKREKKSEWADKKRLL